MTHVIVLRGYTIQCTVVITIRQALQKIGLLSTEVEETSLYSRLNVLLRDSTVDMKVIVTEAVRFVRETKNNSRGEVIMDQRNFIFLTIAYAVL